MGNQLSEMPYSDEIQINEFETWTKSQAMHFAMVSKISVFIKVIRDIMGDFDYVEPMSMFFDDTICEITMNIPYVRRRRLLYCSRRSMNNLKRMVKRLNLRKIDESFIPEGSTLLESVKYLSIKYPPDMLACIMNLYYTAREFERITIKADEYNRIDKEAEMVALENSIRNNDSIIDPGLDCIKLIASFI